MNHSFPQSKSYLNYNKHQSRELDEECPYKIPYFCGKVKEFGPEEDV